MKAKVHEAAVLIRETNSDLALQGQTCADHGLEMSRGETPEDCPVAANGGSYEKCPRFNELLIARESARRHLARLSCNFD